jgi:hypothetical protein
MIQSNACQEIFQRYATKDPNGRKQSDESKAKMSAAQKGKLWSEARRAKENQKIHPIKRYSMELILLIQKSNNLI